MNQTMRLNRYLALCGLGSRRACEEIILAGGVRINGRAVRELAVTVQPGDTVVALGRVVRPEEERYVVLHKPPGVLSSRASQGGKRTVYDLLPREVVTLPHVGRLDAESEGLLLLSNDGVLAQALTHPSRHMEKEYDVVLDRTFDLKLIPKLLKGGAGQGGPRERGRREQGAGGVDTGDQPPDPPHVRRAGLQGEEADAHAVGSAAAGAFASRIMARVDGAGGGEFAAGGGAALISHEHPLERSVCANASLPSPTARRPSVLTPSRLPRRGNFFLSPA